MHETTRIESEQQARYPGLSVRHDGDAIVVHIPMKLRRRNGRQTILIDGEPAAPSVALCDMGDHKVNRTLVEAIAKGHRWQEQLESGEHPTVDDLAAAVGVDRTYVGRMLRLTSLAPDLIETILRSDEPDGLSLQKKEKDLPVRWDEQRKRWPGGC